MALENETVDIEKLRDSAKVLTGTKYCLRAFKEEHISDIYINWLNDPEVNRFIEARFTHQTHQTVLEFVRSFYGRVEKYMWGIYPYGATCPIGTATLHTINRHHGYGEIGMVIGEKDYWGKQASSETIKLVLHFAFDVLGLRRVTGGNYSCNRGMNFTYKMLGFRREGVLQKAYAIGPEVYVDGYCWAILADEWKNRQQFSANLEK